jgi:hypothetical protein
VLGLSDRLKFVLIVTIVAIGLLLSLSVLLDFPDFATKTGRFFLKVLEVIVKSLLLVLATLLSVSVRVFSHF